MAAGRRLDESVDQKATAVAIDSSNVWKYVSQEMHELFCRVLIKLNGLPHFSCAFPSGGAEGVELNIQTAAFGSHHGIFAVRRLVDGRADLRTGYNTSH